MKRATIGNVRGQRARGPGEQPDACHADDGRQQRGDEEGRVHPIRRCRSARRVFCREKAFTSNDRGRKGPFLRRLSQKNARSAARLHRAGRNLPFPVADHHFSASRPDRSAARKCPSDVASAQQRRGRVNTSFELPCQWFPPFGTMGRNFSKELRRFRWQAQKAVSLPNFSVRGETQ